MSRSLNTNIQILPIPSGGANFREPLTSMPANMSPWLLNVDCENQFLRARGGYVRHAQVTDYLVLGLGVHGIGTTEQLFAYTQSLTGLTNKVHNVTTSVPAVAFDTTTLSPDEALNFNAKNHLYFLTETAEVNNPKFDGTAWAAWGITYLGVSARAFASCFHKGRIFLGERTNNKILYGDVGQVTGAFNAVDAPFSIEEIYTYSPQTAWIASFSQADGNVNQQYIAFGNYSGEVLVYSGDSPSLTSWELVSQFRIGKPVGYQPVIAMQNDAFIITYTGLISLRQLFNNGNTAAVQQSVSSAIDGYWTDLFSRLNPAYQQATYLQTTGCYEEKSKKLYILVSGYIDKDGVYDSAKSTMLVYNAITGAWSFHLINMSLGSLTIPNNLIAFNDSVYFAMYDSVFKLDPDSLHDDTLQDINGTVTLVEEPYEVEIDSAWLNVDNSAGQKKTEGFILIAENPTNAAPIGLGVTVDFGARQSELTYPLENDTGTGGIVKPFGSVGETGVFSQFNIRQTIDDRNDPIDSLPEYYGIACAFQVGGLL